jgi:hypothetical protein
MGLLKGERGVTRSEGDKAWREQHDKHGKFQYLFLVLVILQLVFFEGLNFKKKDSDIPKLFHT